MNCKVRCEALELLMLIMTGCRPPGRGELGKLHAIAPLEGASVPVTVLRMSDLLLLRT